VFSLRSTEVAAQELEAEFMRLLTFNLSTFNL
jgi:hypothetical protein